MPCFSDSLLFSPSQLSFELLIGTMDEKQMLAGSLPVANVIAEQREHAKKAVRRTTIKQVCDEWDDLQTRRH